MRIEEAINQAVFSSPSQRANINIIYTAGWLNQLTGQVLRPYDISVQQFNILRILRGRKEAPATIKILTERMLDKMSNASRLVDKLKLKGLVDRQECPADRRRVDITITQAGLELLDKASAVMEAEVSQRFSTLTPSEADQLSNLLDKLRND